MLNLIAFLLTSLCAIPLASAVPWDGAAQTALSSSPGWNPKPTSQPAHDLRRRQQSSYKYDNTCGYVVGARSNSITCADTSTCSLDTHHSVLACCDSSCHPQTHCINYYESSVLCRTSLCTQRHMTLTCSESTAPFCRRWTGSGYSKYGCGTYPAVLAISIPFLTSSTAATATGSVNASCPKSMVSPATITASVIGALVVVAAAAVALAYMLRHRAVDQTHAPAPKASYPASFASSAELSRNSQEVLGEK